MKKIQSKMKGLKGLSYYKSMRIFPDNQGQLTPKSLVRSGRVSNSLEMLFMSLLPTKNHEDPIRNGGARVFTKFPYYNPMGVICCHGNQSSGPI